MIYSDAWTPYKSINSLGLRYKHFVINHSENFVTSEEIHTWIIERFWCNLKEWVKRPGMKSNYMHQYMARCLFPQFQIKQLWCINFFIQAARLNPHFSDHECHMLQLIESDSSSSNKKPRKRNNWLKRIILLKKSSEACKKRKYKKKNGQSSCPHHHSLSSFLFFSVETWAFFLFYFKPFHHL